MTPKVNRALPLLAIIIHLITVIISYILLKEMGLISNYPANNNLIHHDAIWYKRIAENGYSYVAGEMNTMAFFPLFAYAWKFSGLSAVGISLLNGSIYLLGMYLTARHLQLNFSRILIILSTPSIFFCYIPYSESFFFLGAILLLIGIDRKNRSLVYTGTLIASLTRSIGIVFFPAFIFTLLARWKKDEWEDNKNKLVTSGWCCLLISLSTLLVIFLQYIETGEWFVFFEVQKYWHRSFSIPTLPFTTLSSINILWLDGLAFFVAIISSCICLREILLFLLKKRLSQHSPGTNFSLAYLVMMGFICSFFSGRWGSDTGTSLMSINRYVFAVPFFIFFLNKSIFSSALPLKRIYIAQIFIPLILTWITLGAFSKLNGHAYYWQTALYFLCMTLYLLLYLIVKFYPKTYILLYIINLYLQIYLFNTYLSNKWVG